MNFAIAFLIAVSVIASTVILCACWGAGREFRDEMRRNRRPDADRDRALAVEKCGEED